MHMCIDYDDLRITHLRKTNSFPNTNKWINNFVDRASVPIASIYLDAT